MARLASELATDSKAALVPSCASLSGLKVPNAPGQAFRAMTLESAVPSTAKVIVAGKQQSSTRNGAIVVTASATSTISHAAELRMARLASELATDSNAALVPTHDPAVSSSVGLLNAPMQQTRARIPSHPAHHADVASRGIKSATQTQDIGLFFKPVAKPSTSS